MKSKLFLALAAGTVFAMSSLAQAADVEAGKTTFNKCKACHSEKAGENKIGPSLFGVVGRPSASIAGFKYSDAVSNLKITWTPENLDKWLTKPSEMAKGTKMIFPGLPNQADRDNVIAYLSTLK
jgi:cytochrome c